MSQKISVFNILFKSVLFRFDFVLFNIISFLELFYFNSNYYISETNI